MDSGQFGQWRWTVTNKNKSLVSESDGDAFVGKCHTFVGSLRGGAGKVPLVRKLNYLKKFSCKSSGIVNFF